MKRYWTIADRIRLNLYRGTPPMDWARRALVDCMPDQVVIYESAFGGGKTSAEIAMRKQGLAVPVVKRAIRPLQPVETSVISNMTLVDTIQYQEWFNLNETSIARPIVGLFPPYEEWNYWGKRLGVKPVTFAELWGGQRDHQTVHPFNHFIAEFRLEDIALAYLEARQRGIRRVSFSLCPMDARDILAILEEFSPGITQRAVSFYLDSPPELRTERILTRTSRMHPDADPRENVVARVRINEGASTPEIPCDLHPIYRIDSTGPVKSTVGKIARILGGYPVGGGYPTRHQFISKAKYAALYQLFK